MYQGNVCAESSVMEVLSTLVLTSAIPIIGAIVHPLFVDLVRNHVSTVMQNLWLRCFKYTGSRLSAIPFVRPIVFMLLSND